MKLNKNKIVFTGGGTAGHIYPGIAVADELKSICKNDNLQIFWIGCSKGMDRNIVEKSMEVKNASIRKFYSIPSGKLRRYFSIKNFFDLFNILFGFVKSFFLLLKIKPAVLFSKGGFVSVPPCLAAKILGIPVYIHECDFTLGLANRINVKSAKTIFVSYEETKSKMSQINKEKTIVTGNPVRPVFYSPNVENGFKKLGTNKLSQTKPVLLVLGGSLGAKQINQLIYENIEWLCEHFTVVHQTGLVNNSNEKEVELINKYKDSYKPFSFIHQDMQDVLSCADVVVSRAGANSIWETAVENKPMILIPLCGSGTRGDQVDNALFFEEKECAKVLIGENANSKNLLDLLSFMLNEENRNKMKKSIIELTQGDIPAKKIAKIICEHLNNNVEK